MKGGNIIEFLYKVYPATLYPTWFRWKTTYVSKKYLLTKLYIPHGSDERHPKLAVKARALNAFISHMVQMKVFLACV